MFLRVFLTVFALAALMMPTSAHAQAADQAYFLGKVKAITKEEKLPQSEENFYIQEAIVTRKDTNQDITLHLGSEFQPLNANQRLTAGTTIILTNQETLEGVVETVVVDVYRLPVMIWLTAFFFLLVVFVARRPGLFSIFGMILSLVVLMFIMIPAILAGYPPVLVSIVCASIIAVVSIYLSHGFSLKSHIALTSMIGILLVVGLLSVGAVKAAQMVGLGSEEAYFLQFGPTAKINLQGLLLGGIILGALGILDDISVSQVSVVYQLKAANPKLGFSDLYKRALEVGKDHVASLVNTLLLAYAGANLPLFVLFSLNQNMPFWVTLNNEMIMEEVIRTLVGSIGLVMAVPLASAISAWVFANKKLAVDPHVHSHTH